LRQLLSLNRRVALVGSNIRSRAIELGDEGRKVDVCEKAMLVRELRTMDVPSFLCRMNILLHAEMAVWNLLPGLFSKPSGLPVGEVAVSAISYFYLFVVVLSIGEVRMRITP
jgi:hypothetical protein